MQLELKDLSNSQTLLVSPDGVTFGREGGDADVTFKDGGVSKRHARVYLDADVWYLEDLGSSNGTYLQQSRIQQPTELMPGDIFSMSKVRFEVLQIVDEGAPPPPPKKPSRPAKSNGAPAQSGGSKKGRAAPSDEAPPPRKPTRDAPAKGDASRGDASRDDAGRDDAGGDEIEAKGFGYFFIAVPKAIAFYLAAIPLLLVNPIGTVRKYIEEQNHEPMGRMELIAYALPPLLLSQLLGAIAYGIVRAVSGYFSIMDFIPIVPVISAAIGAVVTGLIWHPVLTWVVKILKGESDARSRTNYFLNQMTVSAVLAVPTFVATLLGLVPFRLIAVVGVLLTILAQLVSLYVFYAWWTFFNVKKWFVIAFLVLGGLGVLGGLYTAVMTLIHPPAAVGSVGDANAAAEAASEEAEKALKEAQEQTAAALKAAQEKGDPAAIKAAQEKAIAAAKEAQEKGAAAAKEAQERAAAAAKEAQEKAAKEQEPSKPPDPGTATKEPSKPPDDKQPTPEVVANAPPGLPAVTGSGYPAFAAMREAVEKRITEDPTLLNRVPGLLQLYRDYESDVYEIDAKYQKNTGKHPEHHRVNAHLRDAELYEATEKKVKELYGKLK